MIKVGLTGGIGSGKSFVAQIFEKLHIPVYYSDQEAKRLMTESKELKRNLQKLLGEATYSNTGELNRKYIAQQIFQNKNLLEKINNLVHPAVRKDFETWAENQHSPYVLQESAILFEIDAHKKLDKMILVAAPLETRIQRVIKRDNVTREEVLQRIKNQWEQEKKAQLADFIIHNDEEQMLLPQIVNIHEKISNLAP